MSHRKSNKERPFNGTAVTRGCGVGAALLLMLLSVSGCDSGTDPGEFVAADFYGEWHLSLPGTSCWEAMEIVFLLDQAGTFQFSARSMNVDGRWGIASESSRTRLVQARLDWDNPKSFTLAFFQSGASGAFGLFNGVAPKDTMAPELLQGIFFDQNRQACHTAVTAAKSLGVAQ